MTIRDGEQGAPESGEREAKRWLGVHLLNHGQLSLDDVAACARLADELGYSGLTLNEDVGYDSFAVLASLAGATRSIGLGTAITNVYPRSAMQVAMGAATVDQLSRGRASLGLSIGHHPWNDLYHGLAFDPPLPRLREYVAFVRGVLAGETYEHEGKIFSGVRAKLGFAPYRTDLPIFIAGERGGVLRLSGQVADGAILNRIGANYLSSFATDRVLTAAQDAGRDPDQLEITAVVTCWLSDDHDEGLQRAKETFIAWLRGNPAKTIEMRPEAEKELTHLVELINAGHAEQAVAEVSAELATDTVAGGSPEAVRASILRFYEAGATRVLLVAAAGTRVANETLLRSMQPLLAPR